MGGIVDFGKGLRTHASTLSLFQGQIQDILKNHRSLIFQDAGLAVERETDGTIISTDWQVGVPSTPPNAVTVNPGIGIDTDGNFIVNPAVQTIYLTSDGTATGTPLAGGTVGHPNWYTLYVQYAQRNFELGTVSVTTGSLVITGDGSSDFSRFRPYGTQVQLYGASNISNNIIAEMDETTLPSTTQFAIKAFTADPTHAAISLATESGIKMRIVGDWDRDHGYPTSPSAEPLLYYDYRIFGITGGVVPANALVLANIGIVEV